MAPEPSTYRKLPGKKKHFLFGVHRLWLGEDHLLQVHARMGIEDYQRFYFDDIQAVVTRKTVAGKVYNALLAGITFLLMLIAARLDGPAAVFFFGAGCFFLAALGLNWAMGPTCRTILRTAVQEEALPSLHRLKQAQKVMDRLRTLITASQGTLSVEQISGRPPVSAPPSRRTNRAPLGAGLKTPALPTAPSGGRSKIALMAAALLLSRTVLGILQCFANSTGLMLLDIALFLCLAVAAIAFLVGQYEGLRRPVLLAAAWATTGYVALSTVGGYVLMMVLAFRNPAAVTHQWDFIRQAAELSVRDNPWLLGWQLLFIVSGGVLAAVILLSSGRPAGPSRRSPHPNSLPGGNSRNMSTGRS